jgi:DNA-directed RNA polymerase subunit RPC12/RpoP
MRCSRCGYEWTPKVPSPKECPRCKVRLDYKVQAPPGTPVEKKMEVVKRMPSKLPWLATAVIIVVAVGLVGVFLWPSTVHGWNCLTTAGGPLPGTVALGLLTGGYGDYGIENIFIMKAGQYTLSDNPANWVKGTHYYENISYNNQTVNIPYEENFDIVVVVRIRGDNVAYLTWDNVYTWMHITGAFETTENSLQTSDWARSTWYDNTAPIGAVGKYNQSAYLRYWYQLDNGANHFKLAAGASINFTENLYSWK